MLYSVKADLTQRRIDNHPAVVTIRAHYPVPCDRAAMLFSDDEFIGAMMAGDASALLEKAMALKGAESQTG